MVSEPFIIIELNMNGFFFKGRGVRLCVQVLEVHLLSKEQNL